MDKAPYTFAALEQLIQNLLGLMQMMSLILMMAEKLLLLRVNQKSFLLVFLTTPENSEVENNPRVSVRSECINSRPNTLINK